MTIMLILVIYWLDRKLLAEEMLFTGASAVTVAFGFIGFLVAIITGASSAIVYVAGGIGVLAGLIVGVFLGLWNKEPPPPLGHPLFSLKSRPLRGAVVMTLTVLAGFALFAGLAAWRAPAGPESEQMGALRVLSHPAPVSRLVVSPKGDLLATIAEGDIRLWPVARCAGPSETCENPLFSLKKVISTFDLVFSPDERLLMTGALIGQVQIYRLSTCFDQPEMCQAVGALNHEGIITNMALSPDGTLLALGNRFERTVELWQVDACLRSPENETCGRSLHLLKHEGQVSLTAFAPDGATLASVDDSTLRLWRVSDGTLRHRLKPERGMMLSLAFAPDGAILAAGGCAVVTGIQKSPCLGGRVWLWRSDNGQLLRTLEHESGVTSLAFDPTGDVLAIGTINGQIQLWDVADVAGNLLDTLAEHRGTVTSLAFLPHPPAISEDIGGPGRAILISGSADQTVRLWLLK